MREENETLEVVKELNNKLWDENPNSDNYQFFYMTNGYADYIKFQDEILWSSDEDGRYFDEEKNDYEPLLPYIISLYNKYVEKLNNIKL